MKELTQRQQECLLFIKHYVRVYGQSPTRTEVAKGMKVNAVSTAARCVRALAAKGRLRLTPFKVRSIEVTE